MNVTKTAITTVLQFVAENPNAYQASIQKGTKLAEAVVRESLNQLKAEKKITGNKVGKRVEYTVAVTKAKATKAPKAAAEPIAVKYVVQPGEPKTPKGERNFGRNFARFVYNGKAYHKGKLVDTIIRDYVKEKNPTFAELKAVFPDSLLKTYGIFQDVTTAKEKPGRYFTNKSITLNGGKRIAVCNQWTSENIQPVLGVAKKLGYKVTAEKAVA